MTSHPITDAELARMDRELTDAVERDGELYLTTDAPKDMRRLLAEVDRLRAQLTAAEAGLEKAREDNGRTCYETVFWYDGEYEGECELVKYHAGPHFDGLCWWDDDRVEVEAPATALGNDEEGTPS